MSESDSSTTNDDARYRIGAVCRMTGISQHVLRAWEKRHGVVEPERSETERRLYRESDVARLTLLKHLVDRGQAIGTIAHLEDAELERRLQQSAGALQTTTPAEQPVLMLIGESLAAAFDDCSKSEKFTLDSHYNDISEYAQDKSVKRLDVVVVEWPSLQPDSAIEITRLANQLNTRHLILMYDYAPRSVLQQLPNNRITALRSPLDIAALEAVVAWRFGLAAQHRKSHEDSIEAPPSRQLKDRELAFLATQSPAIACECPRHLAQLISRLVKFEAYSAECESRNSEDAALHNYLHNTTSHARSMMERALLRIIELEDLSLPPNN